jgi:RNA polymerase sigma factor (TIGR02999 family)
MITGQTADSEGSTVQRTGSGLQAATRQDTVTRLLGELREGSPTALNELLPHVYRELRALARLQRRRWHGHFTLDTTALVHEAYLKLVDQRRVDASSRAHFLAVAAKAMRHILCNYARDRARLKRGGNLHQQPAETLEAVAAKVEFSLEHAEELEALDEALRRLEALDERQSQIVECKFFGGMTNEQTAAAVGVAPATVKRTWALARAWLYRELRVHKRL